MEKRTENNVPVEVKMPTTEDLTREWSDPYWYVGPAQTFGYLMPFTITYLYVRGKGFSFRAEWFQDRTVTTRLNERPSEKSIWTEPHEDWRVAVLDLREQLSNQIWSWLEQVSP